eukprot:449911-Pelagomonas_calceolata.AAC.1
MTFLRMAHPVVESHEKKRKDCASQVQLRACTWACRSGCIVTSQQPPTRVAIVLERKIVLRLLFGCVHEGKSLPMTPTDRGHLRRNVW